MHITQLRIRGGFAKFRFANRVVVSIGIEINFQQ